MSWIKPYFVLLLLVLLLTVQGQAAEKLVEEVTVYEDSKEYGKTLFPGAVNRINIEDLESINFINVEDALLYQPNLIVRRRYIGDLNSTLGMRGSNMFQTARSMVFADGLPLHYLLQTQFSGAPRWSLVGPEEIQAVNVIYGPFSAEYSGNAMGGVVEIETRMPGAPEFNINVSAFNQNFSYLGSDDNYSGYQGFISFGNTIGDISFYGFINRLDNESQPLTYSSSGIETDDLGATEVRGAELGRNSLGGPFVYYGDQGPETVTTDLAKVKLGHNAEGDWRSSLTVAFEKRRRDAEAPANYLSDAGGQTFWSGLASADGQLFNVDAKEFYLRDQDRETVLVGVNTEGRIGSSKWLIEIGLSHFDIIKDADLESQGTFSNPDYDGDATLTEFGGSGWDTLDIKFGRSISLANLPIDIAGGYHFEKYNLQIMQYDSVFPSGEKIALEDASGGSTKVHALFIQSDWKFAPQWDMTLGLRYEKWESHDGYPLGEDAVVEREASELSPKFSLGYKLNGDWRARYSLARAFRFPIVEELFQNERRTSGTVRADANLKPENGLHHNLLLERTLDGGFVRINYFDETVEDVIFTQTQLNPRVRTFLPVDEVRAQGLEFSYQRDRVLGINLDVMLNLSYVDAEIRKNPGAPSTEGKQFPRMPKWRSNLLLSYGVTESLHLSAGLRHASNSFGRTDNTDREEEVFGAHDAYTFANAKIDYHFNQHIHIAFGVDNLSDDLAFAFSPWPGRTIFAEFNYSY